MNDVIATCLKNIVEKLNLYKFLQIFWLIEFYFLAIFSGKQAYENIFHTPINEPQVISKYSTKIFDLLTEYNSYIFCLAIILLLVGLSGNCVAKLPFLKGYKLIHLYMDIGWYSGGWLILITFTYWAYTRLNSWFLFAPLIVYFLGIFIKSLWDKFLLHIR